jgi:C-terminal processing protease CtpA/Prc
VADCFLNSDRPLLNWQSGSARATTKTDAISVPVAILVNSQTTGAAEALAAVLRESGVGLILGGQTAGQASIFKEFPLQNGLRLRVAVGQVSLGAGKALTAGVLPDIPISCSLDDQHAYLLDPYKVLHPPQSAKTDVAANPAQDQPRLNETELIREHREGEDAEASLASAKLDTPPPPAVADPVLARALDLLKGLAVVEPARPG